jgi:nucleoside-diphosphate-sugar epimerase
LEAADSQHKKATEGMSKGSVLVTGARGFVGRAVAKLLQREGYRVLPLDLPLEPETEGGERPQSAEIPCDIRRATHLWTLFQAEPVDNIIHLAALLPTAAQNAPLLATQSNITGTLNLLEMARQFNVRRVIFGSSLSVYGTYPAEETVSETHRAAPEDIYGTAKLYAERMGEAYRALFGLTFVSLRIGRVVGPGAQSASSAWRSRIFEELASSEPVEIALPYLRTERLLMVHVEDVARMLVALLEAPKPAHDVYNAACESVTAEELKNNVAMLNPNVRLQLGEKYATGNPRRLDSSRFSQEFGFQPEPIFTQLRRAAGNETA